MKKTRQILFILFCLGFAMQSVFAQAINMTNGETYDCEGTLFDSNETPGDFPTGYDGNEDLTFTICVPGTDEITITFDFLNTEIDRDIISFYDGNDKTAPFIGSYSGEIKNGFVVKSTGECLTIHFISDGSKQFEGWRATWTVNPPPPPEPRFTFLSNLSCGDQSITVQFDEPIPCSELRPDNFTLTGPAGGSVSAVTAVNCVDGFATEAILSFASPLDESGFYGLDLDYAYTQCVGIFKISLDTSFSITDCPLELELIGDDEVCEGFCITLFADVKGGNPNNYQYSWTPNLSTGPTLTICPTTATMVSVAVTDGASQPVSDSKNISIKPLPEAGPDFSICEFAMDTNLTGTPTGGGWGGPGIINSGNGTFRPSNARDGIKTVYYGAPNGCYDSLFVTVHDVNAGPDLSACLNDASFQLTGLPNGGTWAGTNCDAMGNFTPSQKGNFTITYTEPNFSCVDDIVINVTDSIIIPPFDSMVVCINEPEFIIPQLPTNGLWTGTGIVNRRLGRFNPAVAGEGIFMLYYQLSSGCIDSTNIQVTDIEAGNDTLLCPLDAPLILPTAKPAGGVYSGIGVTDNGDGTYTFDPNANGNQSSTVVLSYTFGNCSATKNIFLVRTSVINDTIEFCEYEGLVPLSLDSLYPNPINGTWTLQNHANDTFNTIGLTTDSAYYAVYNFNGNACFDSTAIYINPKPLAGILGRDTSICVRAQDFNLTGTPAGGTWSGPGIVDANMGTFSPTTLGINGTFFAVYTVKGCSDTMIVKIADPIPNISALAENYCINANTYPLVGTPAGGTFSGRGIISQNNGTYSPEVAGPGIDTIVYTIGTGQCVFYDTAYTFIYKPIVADMQLEYRNPICYDDSIPIRVIASGGDTTKLLRYSWNIPGVGNTNFHVPRPYDTLIVEVTVSDLCSYDVIVRDTVFVHPEITYDVIKGAPKCFGDSNYVKLRLTGLGRFAQDISWFIPNETKTDSIFTVPDRYNFTISDTNTMCIIGSSERIPEYPPVIADFTLLPNKPCITIVDPSIYLINNSVGANQGVWIIGDTIIDYAKAANIDYEFKDTANYTVSLTIQNEIGCADSTSQDICVETVKQYFLPNAFSPNGDGDNEFWPAGNYISDTKFIPMGYNIIDYEMQIFNRWGELMYENTTGNNPPWNGTVGDTGQNAAPGVYVYIMKIFYTQTEIIEFTGKVVLLR